MASLIEINYDRIPEMVINWFDQLPPETRAYIILGIGVVCISFVAYLGYIFVSAHFDSKKPIYKLEVNFPKADEIEDDQRQIEAMRSFFGSIHAINESERLSFEIHKTYEYLTLLITCSSVNNVESIRKYLTSIKGLTISLTREEPLEEYQRSYAKRLVLNKNFFTINLEEKALFSKLIDYLSSLSSEEKGSVLFLMRPVQNKDHKIERLIYKNDQVQAKNRTRLTKQSSDNENLSQKQKGELFLVQIYTLGSSSKISRELASIFKILGNKSKFISKNVIGSQKALKLRPRYLFRENLFTPYFRSWFGSYLTSNELAVMIHPTKLERGNYKPNKSLIIESTPEFLEDGEDKLLIGTSHVATGEERRVYFPKENLRRHLYVLGSTGSGKSTVLIRTALSACEDNDKSLIFFDPHEVDLQMIAARLPDLSNVIYFKIGGLTKDNQSGQERKISFNPLFSFKTTDIQKDTLTEDILTILEQEAKDGDLGTSIKKLLKLLISTGVHFADAYYKYLVEVIKLEPEKAEEIVKERQITLPDLPYILRDSYKYRSVVEQVFLHYGDKNIAFKWEHEIKDYMINKGILDGVDNRFSNLLTDTILPVFEGNGFRIADFIRENKKVLIPISETGFGNISKKMITKLLLSQTWAYVQQSYDPENESEKVQIIIDEMQEAESPLLPRMLSEARKYGASLILAHQYLNQVSQRFLNSVLGNVGSTLIFNMGNQQEVKEIVGLFGGEIQSKDISNLPPFHGFLRTIQNQGAKGRALLSFKTMDYRTEFAEINDKERLQKLSNETLEKYGEPVDKLFDKRKKKLQDAEEYFLFGF